MRPVRLILAVLLFTSPAWATWTLRADQQAASCSGAASTCNVTVTNPTAGDLLVGIVLGPNAAITLSSLTCGSDTLTKDTGSSLAAEAVFTQVAYKLSATGGTGTTCTATLSGNPGGAWKIFLQQWTPSSGPAVFDTSNSRDQNTNTTTPVAPAITLTSGANNLILQTENAVTETGISGGCTGGTGYTVGDGTGTTRVEAYCTNSNDSTAPTWTVGSSGKSIETVIAFKETSGGGAVTRHRAVVF